jgi:hypothetical protein
MYQIKKEILWLFVEKGIIYLKLNILDVPYKLMITKLINLVTNQDMKRLIQIV